ncbi:hypothetical protein, partial [Persicitalea sp.]|uniref:hypothetical protein n=1 Tax=Persicitalea sp. TaxID=3100273 RepID=UPI003594850D
MQVIKLLRTACIVLLWLVQTAFAQTYVSNEAFTSQKKYTARMVPGNKLLEGEKMVSANGEYQMRGTSEGDFIIEEIVNNAAKQYRIVYKFPIGGALNNPPKLSFFSFNTDCNLCIESKQNNGFCITNGRDENIGLLNQCKEVTLTDNGRLVLIGKDGSELWKTPKYPQLMPVGKEGVRRNNEILTNQPISLKVVFVEFKDQQNRKKNPSEIWDVLKEGGTLFQEYKRQGLATMKDALVSQEWVQLPENLSAYVANQAWNYKKYIKDTHALLGDKSFEKNTILVIVPIPYKKETSLTSYNFPSSALYDSDQDNKTGIISNVTLGFDAYDIEKGAGKDSTKNVITMKDDYRLMMHEIGHSFGSGDLYPSESPFNHEVGGFGMMADMRGATGFLGWHRFRYGWLASDRAILLDQKGNEMVKLTKLNSANGISLVVIRDPRKYDKTWVIEIAQDVYKKGETSKLNTEGDRLIVYTVEGVAAKNKREIRLVPRKSPIDPAAHLTKDWIEAYSYKDGQTFTGPNAPFAIKTIKKTAEGFELAINLPADIKPGKYPAPIIASASKSGQYQIVPGFDGNVSVIETNKGYVWDVKTKLFKDQP